MTSNAQAIGLGRIVVNSALNQPLDAEISIASIEGNVLESLEIRLATDSDFRRANISIEPVVKLLRFNVIDGETGPLDPSDNRWSRSHAISTFSSCYRVVGR